MGYINAIGSTAVLAGHRPVVEDQGETVAAAAGIFAKLLLAYSAYLNEIFTHQIDMTKLDGVLRGGKTMF